MDHTVPITSDKLDWLFGYNGFFDGESRDSLGDLFVAGSPDAQRWLAGYDAAEAEARSWNPNPTGAELRAAIEGDARNGNLA